MDSHFLMIGAVLVAGVAISLFNYFWDDLGAIPENRTHNYHGYQSNNFRSRESNLNQPSRSNDSRNRGKNREDRKTRRRELESALQSDTASCAICLEKIRRNAGVWSCRSCYILFHLNCIRKWFDSGTDCPMCRDPITTATLRNACLCGQTLKPVLMANVLPHCCTQLCPRRCGMNCHPGPCY